MQFTAEICDLFVFGFEVLIPLVCEDKIEAQKTCSNGLQTMASAIAKILVANRSIQLTGVRMADASVSSILAHRRMALGNELLIE
jgi:hypothetical protein